MPSPKPLEGAQPIASAMPAPGTVSLELSFLTSVFAELSGLPHPARRRGVCPAGRAAAASDSLRATPPERK